jgi:hypothetical protein
MKVGLLALVFLVILPASTCAKSCAAMTRELERLRDDYRTYAAGAATKSDAVTFDGLSEILDKIVALKNVMQKSGCKVPPRKPKAGTGAEPRRKP